MLNLFIGREVHENKRQDWELCQRTGNNEKNGNMSTEEYNNNDTFDGCSSGLDTPEERVNVLNDRKKHENEAQIRHGEKF